MKKDNSIVVIGSLNYDILLKQKRLPKLGETYTVDSVKTGGGGEGANQAVQCRKMGIETYMLGSVGKDVFGDYLVNKLKNYNVNIDYIKRNSKITGLGINNILDDGSLYANIVQGANFSLKKNDLEKFENQIKKSKVMLLQLEIPTSIVELAIDLAAKHDCYIILNAAPAKEVSKDTLKKVDCLIVNEVEASYYCNKDIEDIKSAMEKHHELLNMIKEVLIITMGSKGSCLFYEDNKIHIPALKVKAVDTTGAGDTFVGVFASKLIEGYNYVEAIKYASAASSITVQKHGAQEIMPYKSDIDNIFSNNKFEIKKY
ncbi:ribokinase [Halanaerobium kushneri]|uniref:Ribokinase n=1 Tax=Halanaerobium kushneri TaxID=56779 RepID=A0A1N6SNE9_9FIRM|nr:ribokinase [Halanaerobium kushneri]SIQ42574.1 ribokinase [Halanaerobium kushneri]